MTHNERAQLAMAVLDCFAEVGDAEDGVEGADLMTVLAMVSASVTYMVTKPGHDAQVLRLLAKCTGELLADARAKIDGIARAS